MITCLLDEEIWPVSQLAARCLKRMKLGPQDIAFVTRNVQITERGWAFSVINMWPVMGYQFRPRLGAYDKYWSHPSIDLR